MSSLYINISRLLLVSLSGLLLLAPAYGQSVLEQLISPGPLSEAHIDQEPTCNVCHSSFDKDAQPALCLDCHEKVAADVDKQQGFHGKSPQAKQKPCKECHTEHEGRAFKIVQLNEKKFNHKLTDYPLLGGHKKAKCAQCHNPEKKRRDTPTLCFSCHKKDEPHKGNLGETCQDCHNVFTWSQIAFDHEVTKFPLRGKHAQTECKACHQDEIYKDLPGQCVDCHQKDDSHKGKNGTQCQDCHQPAGWDEILFDHQTRTGFALLGQHKKIDCAACHTVSLTKPKLKTSCYSCHRKDDVHKGFNGSQCQDCHNNIDWRQSKFDHGRETKFPLRGAHRQLVCADCHIKPVTVALPGMACIDCHRQDDPHEGSQGEDCASCHNEVAWNKNTQFDHDFTNFPLLAKHKQAQCDDCHKSKNFALAPTECVACHEEEDTHNRTLGTQCSLCHSPIGWDYWFFDHNKQTDFALTGAHEGLHCSACHTGPLAKQKKRVSACVTCHRADDVHHGEFGSDCARCHVPEDFKKIKIN